jgi:hypothetical protein
MVASKRTTTTNGRPRPKLTFRAVFERDGRWIVGSSPDVPGAFSQEKSLRAARKALLDVVRDFAQHDRKLARRLLSKGDYVSEETLTVQNDEAIS